MPNPKIIHHFFIKTSHPNIQLSLANHFSFTFFERKLHEQSYLLFWHLQYQNAHCQQDSSVLEQQYHWHNKRATMSQLTPTDKLIPNLKVICLYIDISSSILTTSLHTVHPATFQHVCRFNISHRMTYFHRHNYTTLKIYLSNLHANVKPSASHPRQTIITSNFTPHNIYNPSIVFNTHY